MRATFNDARTVYLYSFVFIKSNTKVLRLKDEVDATLPTRTELDVEFQICL